MDTNNGSKLKNMLALHRPGAVMLSGWLEANGISRDLQKVYKKNGWLQAIGAGAVKRPDDKLTWHGGLFALQQQAHIPVHAGALTALTLQGLSHFFRTQESVFLFAQRQTKLPLWFKNYDWGTTLHLVRTSVLPIGIGLTEYKEKNFAITIAAPERAILECLYLAPKELDLVECYHLLESLTNLRPEVVQELLQKCTSVKIKRVFLYMASKAQHQWLSFVDRSKIDLGSGNRSLVKGGSYNAEYKISLPKELA
ncbi:MAG: type IV toxin-antitoxin system AbiEi family antitoxin [Bacteroidetes bacterium]|jgi:hypothetical protein|nr:type IV toxin-antitoxin system AbiEi family antitoxin [Bacteroidota bacterium]